LAPLNLPACPCNACCRYPSPPRGVGSGCCPLRCGRTGGLFPKDETYFSCIHRATSQSSIPSWLHTFPSACLLGRCYSPGTASPLPDSQRLTGYLVYPEGLPVHLAPSSIPSNSFHSAHMDSTTRAKGLLNLLSTPLGCCPYCHDRPFACRTTFVYKGHAIQRHTV
jgi:hypothetical protein